MSFIDTQVEYEIETWRVLRERKTGLFKTQIEQPKTQKSTEMQRCN